MGCPDWPKCFGEYIPPAESELPNNYRELFLEERIQKNEKLAKVLSSIGMTDSAQRILNDPNVNKTEAFDSTKAWIEYANRLVGVVIGLFVLLNMIYAFQYWNKNKLIPILGVSVFLLTGFQGWVGSLVVSTNLLPGFLTFHMVLALVIVLLLIYMHVRSREDETWMVTRKMKWLIGIFVILLVPQIITGTLTREQVDVLLESDVARRFIPEQLSGAYFIHRSYSWLMLGLAIASYFLLRRNGFINWPRAILVVVFIEVLLGISMVFMSMPIIFQPFHLLLATLLLGGLFYLFLRIETVKV